MKYFNYLFVLCLLLGCATKLRGQNLVPNPSFEEFTTCPTWWGQLPYATGWSWFRGTPDYFNACDTVGGAGVPDNVAGYQQAAAGVGYAGGYIWDVNLPDKREQLGSELISSLIPGIPVYISFRVCTAGDGKISYAASGAGMKFSMNAFSEEDNDVTPLANIAALFVDSVNTDTANWYTVSGIYVPDSAYHYVQLGGFFSDALVIGQLIDPNAQSSVAYVYFDDVCVSTDPNYCDMYSGVSGGNKDESIGAYITDDGGLIVSGLSSSAVATYLSIIDMHGHWTNLGVLPPHSVRQRFQLPSMADGVYILCLENSSGRSTRIKLAIVSP